MTLTPLCSIESAREKFLMNSTYIMSRKWDQTFLGIKHFWAQETEMIVTPISSLESVRKNF